MKTTVASRFIPIRHLTLSNIDLLKAEFAAVCHEYEETAGSSPDVVELRVMSHTCMTAKDLARAHANSLRDRGMWVTIEESTRPLRVAPDCYVRITWGAVLSNGDAERAIATREFFVNGDHHTTYLP